jgi:7-cyano-7-deazaguanine synthase
MRTLHVYSGGLDSTVLLSHLIKEKHEVRCLSFSYGSKHNEKERMAANLVSTHWFDVPLYQMDIDLSMFKSALLQGQEEVPNGYYTDDNQKKTVVPFRNGIMLAYAAGLCESIGFDDITIGAHAGDHAIYPDCRAAFIDPMSEAIYRGTYKNIVLRAPFLNLSKTEIVKIGAEIKAPMDISWSCYKGGDLHCGECGACQERKEAFKDAGVRDFTIYMG